MRLQTTQAIYTNRRLIFLDPEHAPQNGVEVVVTYLEKPQEIVTANLIQALRGRGKGENLVDRLLQSRQKDCAHDERIAQQTNSSTQT